jgi:hypothetical protein
MGRVVTLCPQRGQPSVHNHVPNTTIDDAHSVPAIHACDGTMTKYPAHAMKAPHIAS